jgi:peptidoglycan hydrolase-like protein with peptidoglycan-binding domain
VRRQPAQRAPTQERYQEVQRALAERGYYNGATNGVWGTESVEALKRFQEEQHLAPSGRLNSVSIIALGLGPKRNLTATPAPDSNTQPRPQDENRRPQGSERP